MECCQIRFWKLLAGLHQKPDTLQDLQRPSKSHSLLWNQIRIALPIAKKHDSRRVQPSNYGKEIPIDQAHECNRIPTLALHAILTTTRSRITRMCDFQTVLIHDWFQLGSFFLMYNRFQFVRNDSAYCCQTCLTRLVVCKCFQLFVPLLVAVD